jgi:transcriptional regulator with XRE-family HTH domain
MADEILTWASGNDMVQTLGSEKWLARRVLVERQARGWSQAELSRRLRKAGYPLHQSAISKIESPPKGEGARAITIGEAIGLARVFDIPLGELLLPPEAMRFAAYAHQLVKGPELMAKVLLARTDLNDLVTRVAQALAETPEFRPVFVEHYRSACDRVVASGRTVREVAEVEFLNEVLDAYKAQVGEDLA